MSGAALLLGVDQAPPSGGGGSVFSLSFDGLGTAYVDCGTDTAAQFTVSQPFSVSLWVKPHGTTQNIDPLTLANPSTAAGWYLRWNRGGNSELELYVYDGTGGRGVGTGTGTVPADTWTHVVFTLDGTNTDAGAKAYVNGSEATETYFDFGGGGHPTNPNYASGHCNHGRRDDNGEYFNGKVCQPAIFSGVLSPTQISSLHSGADPTTIGSPVNVWKYTEGTGTTAADSAGTATGTLNGTVTWSTDIPAAL